MVAKAQMMEVFPLSGAVGTASPAWGDRRISFASRPCWRACCGMAEGGVGREGSEEDGYGRGMMKERGAMVVLSRERRPVCPYIDSF